MVAAGAALSALVVIASFLLAVRSKKTNWPKYLAEHHCQKSGYRAIGATGETIYRCADGQIIVLPGRR
jgi:hypothetical protein